MICAIGLGVDIVKFVDDGITVVIGVRISGSQFLIISTAVAINTAASNKQTPRISIFDFNGNCVWLLDLSFSITCVE